MTDANRTRSRLISFSMVAFLAVALIFGVDAHADLVTLVNADFELGSPAPPSVDTGGTSYVGNIPGWNVVNAGGVFEPDFISEFSYPASVQATTNSFVAYSNSNTSGLISQLLDPSITLQSDSVYVLSVDIGHQLDGPFAGGFGFFRLANPFPTGIAGIAAADPGAGSFSRQSFTLHGSNIPGSDLGDPFRIGFYSLSGFVADFDNVTLDISSAVPEPTMIAFLLPGSLCIFFRRKRKLPWLC